MPSDRARARAYHEEERTQQARVADESFRSTQVTEDYETWRQNPGRWDFAGVDTIPEERKKQRAERALETAQNLGLVEEVVEASSSRGLPGSASATTRGNFQGATKELGLKTSLDDDQRQETLAHEIGHAVDYGDNPISAGGMQDSGLAKNIDDDLEPVLTSERMTGEFDGPIESPNQSAEELRSVSEDTRGEFDFGESEYRDSPKELFADFLGSAILRPRNTKAKTEDSRQTLAETMLNPPERLEPTKEFLEEQLPGNFLPEPE